MSTPVFDFAKCKNDALCTRVCPVGALRVGKNGRPEVDPDNSCIGCGHCVSVCPTMALSREGIATEQLEPLAEDWRIESAKISQFLRGRRSTRVFRDQPLDRDTLEELIRLAQYAPSGHNTQPLGWTVVCERAQVRAIANATVGWMRQCVAQGSPYVAFLKMPAVLAQWERGRDAICRNAPHLIIAHAPEQLPSGSHTGAIAITYLEVGAASLGVGTCWAGFLFVGAGASPELHAALGLPKGQRCAGAVLAGRPALSHLRIPTRRTPTIHWR